MTPSNDSPTLLEQDQRFREYYFRHLEPLERRFERLRVRAVSERNRRLAAAVLAWVAAIAGVVRLASPLGDLVWFVGFFALATGVGLGLWVWLPAGAHNLRLQEQVLSRIVPFFGDLRYRQEPDIAPGRFAEWKILPRYSRDCCEDQIEGTYRGVPLKAAEVTLKYEYRSRSSSSSSTAVAFKGLMVELTLAGSHPGVTLIRSEGSDMKGRFHVDEELVAARTASGFEAFATPDAAGNGFADPVFLDRLAEVAARFKARQLFASVHADRLVLLIDHGRNLFEMSHRQETDFARDAGRVRSELGQIFAIVDLLGLGARADDGDAGERPASAVPELPAEPEPGSPDAYDVGGWGCLLTFVLFAAAMLGYLQALDPEMSRGAILWWSALGGSLASLGLYQISRGIRRGSMGAHLTGIVFLAGALLILYYFVPPDLQARLRTWLPGG